MTETTRRRIRIRLKEIRERFQLSQKQLAEAAGIRQATVSALEGGASFSLETLERLCAALGVEPGDLFEIEAEGDEWRIPPALEKYYAAIVQREHEDIRGNLARLDVELGRTKEMLLEVEAERKKQRAKKGKRK